MEVYSSSVEDQLIDGLNYLQDLVISQIAKVFLSFHQDQTFIQQMQAQKY